MRQFQRGFTMIEMMVVIVLVAMLLVGVSTLLLSNLKGGGKATILADLRDEGDAAISVMERELRFGSSPVCIDSNTLTFKSQEGKEITYVVKNSVIKKQIDGGSEISLFGGEVKLINPSANVFSCTITSNSFQSPNVAISFTLTNSDGGEVRQQFQTTVSLRNKEE
jgi:prepilin-type N-terminal cleavage/methylation domain-containing protein